MKTKWTKGAWHYEKKGAVDNICQKCQNESWWINPYWTCFTCDLRWNGYFTDKTRTIENNVCGVYCCRASLITQAKKVEKLANLETNQHEY